MATLWSRETSAVTHDWRPCWRERTLPLCSGMTFCSCLSQLKCRQKIASDSRFDTSMAPLVFADQYLQLSAKLATDNIYGLGEHVHQNFRHSVDWKTWPIFSRDAFPNGGTHNLYGHYPYFMCLEDETGKSFGVFLMNSNAMDVVLQPAPAVTYRTIGGVLDFYIMLGDTPEAIVQEFTMLVGRPAIPPYWSLGFQLSRWDYGSLAEVKTVVERNRVIGLPYDIQYTDIDYMEEKKDFTYDMVKFKDLPQFADYMHEQGQKYILILDPAISTKKRINGAYGSYDRGSQTEAWITESDGKTPLVGEVWPGETVFPDYTKQSCINWWVDEIRRFHKEVKHDAIWIDMNEVSSFVKGSNKGCTENKINNPPYIPNILDKLMYSKTLCMDAKQAWGNHYDVHSLYGYSMVLATEQASKEVFSSNRSFILTRSSFPGVGKYSGHWLGDNAATWNDLKWAIPGMLEFNIFGVPYIGADICGFFDNTTVELCTRWMQVGAFYPFSRNHNAQGYKDQDPASFGPNSLLVNTSKHYLEIRYTLLPYLYTLFYKAHINGDTVVRPIMHEFYSDKAAWTVDRQFLWGSHLLITPVLDNGVDTVNAYIPDAVWYDYETEKKIKERKGHFDMKLPIDKLGLHIRGGAILPTQRPAVTTTHSRRLPMGLIIALDDNNQASGELFWDDGDSRDTVSTGAYIHYQFKFSKESLLMEVVHNGYTDPNDLVFENITVLGMSSPQINVTIIEGGKVSTVPGSDIQYDDMREVLYLRRLHLQLAKNYTVRFSGVSTLERFNCQPDILPDENDCSKRGCIWEPSDINVVPSCYYPSDYGYTYDSALQNTSSGLTFTITRNQKYRSPWALSENINTLRVEITYLTDHSLRFKIYDPAEKRYEVPVPINISKNPETDEAKRKYEVKVSQQPFGIRVIRKDTGTTIWDSTLPTFTFSDMFIQISTRLPSRNIYGFGETEHSSFRHDLNWQTWGMFSKDQPPGDKMNCYGVHPFYMGLETTGHAHGVLLLNSNAMDVTLQPTPALTYRTIGGILDFYMVMGPTPELVVQQYTDMIGRPVLPAYWSLGFQLCRYGYANDQEIKTLYQEMKDAGIPYDVQYADIDYMERQVDFKLNPAFSGLPEWVEKMQKEGLRFIFILDPAISANETSYPAYERGVRENVFITSSLDDHSIVWGKVWPDYPNVTVNESLDWDTQVKIYRAYTAFPDFFRNTTAAWWHREISEFYNNVMKFDGLWIDMNEPASFVHGTVGGKCPGPSKYDYPPYMPPLESKHEGLKHKTLCMNSQQVLPNGDAVKHYDVHNLYGWSHTKPTYNALREVTKKRGIIVTRSTYPSSGQWAGHWLGDNSATWNQLHKSIIGMMEFSLFGISYTGADICGFFNPATYEMCLRWMQLGAFYPYSRNHNGKGNPRQDPVSWDETFINASRDVLNTRYTLLPYLYTLMYEAHTKGSTVIRPLLHEFVEDQTTWDIDKQFLWGPALLITPVLEEGKTSVSGYLPNSRWYDYYKGEALKVRGRFVDMDAPLNHINLHVRGGYILPWQKPEFNTHLSRKNPLGLIVALSDTGKAQGTLFWDDGEGIDTIGSASLLVSFTATMNTLTSSVQHNSLPSAHNLTLGDVRVWGAESLITNVTMQTAEITFTPTFKQNSVTRELFINMSDIFHLVHEGFNITWTTEA
ncbi:maltase-glucoamylase isoform X2 [Brachyhypopomus gauderio]|uniref:maltase-glucoamylase isoform X2 n=1 Tax=Brachyhypopomus gauderio TaxID=698409 RepID=UPI004043181B